MQKNIIINYITKIQPYQYNHPQMQKRLNMEIKQIQQSDKIAVIDYDESDLHLWKLTINGPELSPYQNAKFHIQVLIPFEYPMKPPTLTFITPIYHPNVDSKTGEICKDIYTSEWTPVKKIIDLVVLIQTMMLAPNLSTPIENEIALQYQQHYDRFIRAVNHWINEHCK